MSTDTRFLRERLWLQVGWTVKAFVCLDCGLLTQFLSEEDLRTLRAERGPRG